MSLVFDDVPVALLLTDADGAVTATNRAWDELAALAGEDCAGDGWLGMVHEGDRHRLLAALHATVTAVVPATVDVELVTATGGRPTRWGLSPRGDGAGVVVAIVDVGQEPASVRVALSADVADRLINDLFAVGLTLTSCAIAADEAVTSRLTSAIDDLDRIIHDVRIALVGNSAWPPSMADGLVDGPAASALEDARPARAAIKAVQPEPGARTVGQRAR